MKHYVTTLLACLFAAFLVLQAGETTALAQSEKVSVNARNVSVKTVLKMIENQSGYTFAFVDSDIEAERKVSLNAESRSISSILAELLPGVKVEVSGKRIVLTKAPVAQQPRLSSNVLLKGVIRDEKGETLVNAAVQVKGTSKGVISDLDGNFSIEVKAGDVLVFSSLGYGTLEIAFTGQESLDVVLREDTTMLDDVVVVGYGVQNKRDVTTSIVSIKADQLTAAPTADFREAMAARMPGVQVTQLGGQPDGNVNIRVRGIQSATSGNDPLYVIDGVPCDQRAFANLDASDIESLEVLKDASASAIYGSRGSCGVILITTKRGSSETPVVTYDGTFSVSNVNKKIEMLDAYEFAQMYKESRDGSYIYSVPSGSIGDADAGRPQTYHRTDPMAYIYLADETGTLTNTDWQDAIFRTALSTKHAVSVSARTKNYNYYVGGNYLYREGTIINSDFVRYGLRANLDGKKGRLSYGFSLSPSFSKTNYVSSDSQYGSDGVIASALMAPPVFPVYNSDGSYNWDMNGYFRRRTWDTQVNEVLNPVALAREITDVREKINVVGNGYVGIRFIEGLEYKLTLGMDFYQYNRNYYRPSYLPLRGNKYLTWNDELGTYDAVLSTPLARTWSNTYFHWSLSNQISFNRKFGDHSVSAVAVYEAEKQQVKSSQIYAEGVPGDDKIRTTKGKTIIPDETYNNSYAYTFASWLVRAQYSYKGRYMVSASIRGDASSRFGPNNRWGYFPAASIGWRISDEPWFKARSVDDMKIRASVGQTGNAQIGNSEYLALYGTANNVVVGSGLTNQVYPSQIANNDLGWEKNTQYNVGVDLSMLKGYLGLNVDAYYSRTTNMLFDVPVSSVSGLTSSNVNIGSMENKGVEISLSSRHQFGDFSYEVGANWSLNRNKVLSLGEDDAPIIKESDYAGAYYITKVGEPVGCYYLMVQDGIFHNRDELEAYPHFNETMVGDFRFVDVDGDGVLEKDEDRAIVGNYMPDFYYGFNISLGWKGIDLSASFQGVYGNEILNLERRYLCNMEASSNMMKESLNRFPYGELNRATRKSSGNNGAATSTFHLEDGSYLRLQNLSLGYSFPSQLLKKAKMGGLRVFVQGSNLFTWTNYTGYNPEVNKNSSDALRPGEDYCSYPLSRTFTVGLNIKF